MNLFKIIPKSIIRRVHHNISRHSDAAFDVAIARNSVAASLWRLKKIGFEPLSIFDVGAYEGLWSVEVAKIFPRSKFYLFEALANKEPTIIQNIGHLSAVCICRLLGPLDDKRVTFNAMESGSSIMPEPGHRDFEKMELTMSRLDSLVSVDDCQGPVLLKLDVQGFELEVLKGATALLPLVEVLVLEVSLVAYNLGAPSATEVIANLDKLGFVLYDFGEMHRKSSDDTLLQVDMIFVAKNSQWKKSAEDLTGHFTVYTD